MTARLRPSRAALLAPRLAARLAEAQFAFSVDDKRELALLAWRYMRALEATGLSRAEAERCAGKAWSEGQSRAWEEMRRRDRILRSAPVRTLRVDSEAWRALEAEGFAPVSPMFAVEGTEET